MIEKLFIRNYKIFKNKIIDLNKGINIFVGENDSGKSTFLEALSIITTGKLNGVGIDRQLKTSLFNDSVRKEYIEKIKNGKNVSELPSILIEAYCINDPSLSDYKGTNNDLAEECAGIGLTIDFDKEYSEKYQELLESKEIFDIPIEFYKAKFSYFNGTKTVLFRTGPFKVSSIDTTRKDYSYIVNRFVSDNISSNLTEKEIIDLSVEYRKNRNGFIENSIVKALNNKLEKNIQLADKKIQMGIQETALDHWKSDMTISVDDTLFDNVGFGTQNSIKIELAIKNKIDETNIILVEEPENNLSYGNMAKLLSKIFDNSEKQIFISTHSSYVVNKLGLSNVFILCQGKIASLKDLDEETIRYFMKLPGYDTLRLVLANKVILVEGPTEELLITRAYIDKYGKDPIQDGIDILSVGSLAFKRYCNIAKTIRKKVKIVTDNDGDINKNITQKYNGYSDVEIFYDHDESNYTLEVSVLNANKNDFDNFRKSISKKDSLVDKDEGQILDFMKNNKVEWAMRVYSYKEKIEYPEYIKNVIE